MPSVPSLSEKSHFQEGVYKQDIHYVSVTVFSSGSRAGGACWRGNFADLGELNIVVAF